MPLTFQGAMTALVTPFRNGHIDEAALQSLVEDQIAAGIDALVPCGTTGESPTLSEEEHLRVVTLVASAARRRVPVLAGAGSNDTAHAIHLSKRLLAVGVDGLLHITPYYNRPSQEGLYRHFRAIAEAVDLPIVLYNVPSRTGCDLLPETLERLASFPNIVGIKEATGQIVRTQQIRQRLGDRLALFSGEDLINYPLYCVGARGTISVTSNVAPKLVADLWDATSRGDHVTASALHYRLLPLTEALFSEVNPIPVKAALHLLGRISPETRLPLGELGEAPLQKLRKALSNLALV
jgi:4-hydroxy-tetrahydrodipicolinate synthase